MQIFIILLTTPDDDGGGDHPVRAQLILFNQGPNGAPHGQQGPRAEQAPEDQEKNSNIPGCGIPTDGGGSFGVAHGMEHNRVTASVCRRQKLIQIFLSLFPPCTLARWWGVRPEWARYSGFIRAVWQWGVPRKWGEFVDPGVVLAVVRGVIRLRIKSRSPCARSPTPHVVPSPI